MLLERIRDDLAVLLRGYDLNTIYKATMYALAYTALARSGTSHELLKPLEGGIPISLVAVAKGRLYYSFLELLDLLDMLLSSKRPVIVEGEANLQFIIDWLRREVMSVDYVMVYDCMSLVEFLAISAYLHFKEVQSVFLSKAFLNPVGLTKFVTQQLHDMDRYEALREVARLIAESLKGIGYYKSSYLDRKVHKYGLLGIEKFVEIVNIDEMAEEILSQAIRGKLLVGTDHGYDLVMSKEDGYIYITHGFKPRDMYKVTPLLLLSRLALFMEAYK